jgi:hypothetical protein
MKHVTILIGLTLATAACQQASASNEPPAPDPRTELRTPDRFMPRSPETRARIQPGRIKCKEPVPSIPC